MITGKDGDLSYIPHRMPMQSHCELHLVIRTVFKYSFPKGIHKFQGILL